MVKLTESSGVSIGFHLPFIIEKLDHVPLSFKILLPPTEFLHEGDGSPALEGRFSNPDAHGSEERWKSR
jgi:hypothetical protein